MCAGNIKSYLCKTNPNKAKNMSNKITEDLKYTDAVFQKR